MFWSQHFITSITLVNSYKGIKLKILETNQKSEETANTMYPIFCAFRDFCCNFVKRKYPCLAEVY